MPVHIDVETSPQGLAKTNPSVISAQVRDHDRAADQRIQYLERIP